MRSSDFILTLIKVFAPLLTLLASYLSLKLTRWLDTKIKDQELKNIVGKLNIVIPDVVKDIEQSFVLKEKLSCNSNRLSDESAVTAKTMAVDRVKQQIGDKGMGEIKEILEISDSKANSLIASKVEARVFDLRKITTAILPFIFFMTMGCHTTPLSATAAIIKSQENLVRSTDSSVVTWYIGKDEICLKNGITSREYSKSNGKLEQEARADGLQTYNECMKNPTEIAMKIANLIDLIRSKDKVAANVALAVAKGERPVEAMGYVTIEVSKLISDLTKLLRDTGIN